MMGKIDHKRSEIFYNNQQTNKKKKTYIEESLSEMLIELKAKFPLMRSYMLGSALKTTEFFAKINIIKSHL